MRDTTTNFQPANHQKIVVLLHSTSMHKKPTFGGARICPRAHGHLDGVRVLLRVRGQQVHRRGHRLAVASPRGSGRGFSAQHVVHNITTIVHHPIRVAHSIFHFR